MGRKRKRRENRVSSRNVKSRVLTKFGIRAHQRPIKDRQSEKKRVFQLCRPNPCTVANIFRSKLPMDLGLLVVNFADNYSKRCNYCNLVCNNGQDRNTCNECDNCFHKKCMPHLPVLDDIYKLCASCIQEPKICETCEKYASKEDTFECADCSGIFHYDCCEDLYDGTRNGDSISVCDDCVNESIQACADCENDISTYHLTECSDCENMICDNCQELGMCDSCYEIYQTEINKRKDDLEIALSKMGLVLRDDSKICAQFINGSEDYSVEEIVQMMCRARLFHEYCEWNKFYYKIFNMHSGSRICEYVECSLSSCLPNDGKWPWLNGVSIEAFRKSDKYQFCIRRNGLA